MTVLLCVFQLLASLKSSRGDIGGIFGFFPMQNSILRGAVMYPSPMTLNVTNFDHHFADMAFDIYEMSRSDNGTLTLLETRFSAQRSEQLRVHYRKVAYDHYLRYNQGVSCVAVDPRYLSCFCFPWNEPTTTLECGTRGGCSDGHRPEGARTVIREHRYMRVYWTQCRGAGDWALELAREREHITSLKVVSLTRGPHL